MFPDGIPKTAVTTPFGLFEYLVMPFGLLNVEQTFKRYFNHALGDVDLTFAYFDDILITTNNLEEHKEHLEIVLQKIKKFPLRANLGKSILGID